MSAPVRSGRSSQWERADRFNKTLHLQAGDPIVEVVDTWHYGKNEGAEPADIIVFYAGTSGTPLSIKEE